jgi:hypothetical protein
MRHKTAVAIDLEFVAKEKRNVQFLKMYNYNEHNVALFFQKVGLKMKIGSPNSLKLYFHGKYQFSCNLF